MIRKFPRNSATPLIHTSLMLFLSAVLLAAVAVALGAAVHRQRIKIAGSGSAATSQYILSLDRDVIALYLSPFEWVQLSAEDASC
jgi:hypothetical protein